MSRNRIKADCPADWPRETRAVYEGLRTYRIVGASACVTAIMRALQALAAHVAARDTDNVVRQVREAGTRFCALKPSTAAYVNAVRWLLTGLDADSDARESADLISVRVGRYAAYSRESVECIVDTACSLLPARGRILVHDYSSTVLAITDEAGRRGRVLTVFVTAGEPMGQGPKVAYAMASAGHRVVYLPDAGIGRVMAELDLIFTGVETLFRDGDLANSVGTYPLALTARDANVPVYGVTERIKIHPTMVTASVDELNALVLHPWPDADQVLPAGTDVRREVLDLTPARLIAGYVTEEGVLDPSRVPGALDRLYEKLAGAGA